MTIFCILFFILLNYQLLKYIIIYYISINLYNFFMLIRLFFIITL
ncbi:hypothetical protein SBF1_2690001 [Candidatus Desulfosporosinus infrequens]|uniref:Uncharacterized protein n=1 Tax=Candidatus Desulfosporosinus infrequens TaxID=2043169 RepID=A0A2U3KTG4_9FIRM|nr:hypothetical protein SBF1_2690001 [Candidatus Desulfosporosinus infrequens]